MSEAESSGAGMGVSWIDVRREAVVEYKGAEEEIIESFSDVVNAEGSSRVEEKRVGWVESGNRVNYGMRK